MIYCNYYKNYISHLIYSYYDIDIINCSIYKNDVGGYYFEVDNKGTMLLQGIYLDVTNPTKYGTIKISQKNSSPYPDNQHSSFTCIAELKLDLSEDNENKDEPKVNYKQHNSFNYMIFLVS